MKTKNILFSVLLIVMLNSAAQENSAKNLPFIKACLNGQASNLAATAPLSLGEKIKHWGIPITAGLVGGYFNYTELSACVCDDEDSFDHNEDQAILNEKTILALALATIYFLVTKFAIMKKDFPSVATQITNTCAKLQNNLKNSDSESLSKLTSQISSPSEIIATAKTIDFV